MSALMCWAMSSVCFLVVVGICVYGWLTRNLAQPLTDRDRRLSAVDDELDRMAGVR